VTGGSARALRHWQELDRRLADGEFDMEEVVKAARESGLIRRVGGPGPPNALREVWVIEPKPIRHLVPAPLVLLEFKTDVYSGPRIYRPIGDEARWGGEIFP
jgi:hypothetical protein